MTMADAPTREQSRARNGESFTAGYAPHEHRPLGAYRAAQERA